MRLFEADALFTPRVLTYSCTNCDDEMKKDNCFSNGEYCAYQPKVTNYVLEGISGKQMLQESLR